MMRAHTLVEEVLAHRGARDGVPSLITGRPRTARSDRRVRHGAPLLHKRSCTWTTVRPSGEPRRRYFASWSCWFQIGVDGDRRLAHRAVLDDEEEPPRWPRTAFVIESIALIPVCGSSFTGWPRSAPSAFHSGLGGVSVSVGPDRRAGSRRSRRPVRQCLADRRRARSGTASLLDLLQGPSATPTLSSSG